MLELATFHARCTCADVPRRGIQCPICRRRSATIPRPLPVRPGTPSNRGFLGPQFLEARFRTQPRQLLHVHPDSNQPHNLPESILVKLTLILCVFCVFCVERRHVTSSRWER